MKHILLECNTDARELIWKKAKELWPQEWPGWPNIKIGTILGIGQITLTGNERQQEDENDARRRRMKGRTRLLQILISEASHLIWVLRCERIMHRANRQHTNQEISARWLKVINDRLTTDRITATKIKRDKSFTNLINTTWTKTLKTQGIPHRNWVQRREVFSG